MRYVFFIVVGVLIAPKLLCADNHLVSFSVRGGVGGGLPASEIERKTGQRWIAGQLVKLAKTRPTAATFSRNSRAYRYFAKHRGPLKVQVIRDLFWDKIRSIGIAQGGSFFNAKFPIPSPPPEGIQAQTLRETSSLILTVRIRFIDGSAVNLLLPKVDPMDIDSIYAFAEKRLSPVNGFWTSKLTKADRLFEVIGAQKLTPKDTQVFGANQIGLASF